MAATSFLFQARVNDQTPSLPVPEPANDATREKQIPFRSNRFAADSSLRAILPLVEDLLLIQASQRARPPHSPFRNPPMTPPAKSKFLSGGNNGLVFHFLRRKGPGVLDYIPEAGGDLQTWTPVPLANAFVSSIDSTWERVIVATSDSAREMGRVTVVSSAASLNDFANGPGGAALYGTAAWTSGGIRLTDNTMGQLGGMVMESTPVVPGQTAFTASFNVTLGPTTTVVPADGMSFFVGSEFGSGPWGESGPHTAHSLALGFDTYNNGPANDNIGIHLWINGAHVAVSPVNPYTNGFPTLVQVRYSPTGKLSVTYGGQPIFNDLTTPGFTLQPGDRYGFGARTGGATQVCTVDDVVISPQ